jgi:hypothetical protein
MCSWSTSEAQIERLAGDFARTGVALSQRQ